MLYPLDTSPDQLRRGCILATIAHAIFTARSPELANEQSWDGANYNVQDSQGSVGTVTFDGTTVGAFFDTHSPRNPVPAGQPYDNSVLLAEMPTEARSIAEEETFQFLLQEYQGREVPLVTSVFWNDGERLVATEEWKAALANGARLVETQLRPTDEGIEAWRAHYTLSDREVDLLRSIFSRRTEQEGALALTEDEHAVLGTAGLEQSKVIFAGINIQMAG